MLTIPLWVSKVWQFICQHSDLITALTASLSAKEPALHAYKLEYIKPEFIESQPIRSKASITFYNSLHSSNYIKIFIVPCMIYINVLLRTLESWFFTREKKKDKAACMLAVCTLFCWFRGGKEP